MGAYEVHYVLDVASFDSEREAVDEIMRIRAIDGDESKGGKPNPYGWPITDRVTLYKVLPFAIAESVSVTVFDEAYA